MTVHEIDARLTREEQGYGAGCWSGADIKLLLNRVKELEGNAKEAVSLIDLWIRGTSTQAGLPQLVYGARAALILSIDAPAEEPE